MSDVSVRLSLNDDASSTLDKVANKARTTSSQLQQMGRQIDNIFKTGSPEQFASTLGSAMETASDGADSLGESVASAMEEFERGMNANLSDEFKNAASGAGDLADALDDAGESIEGLTDSAKGLGESIDGLGDGSDGLDGLKDGADGAGESMEKTEAKASSLGNALKKLFAVVSAAAILHQVGGLVNDSIDIGKDYTSMMSEVQAISGATGSEIAQLESTAREYGATTVFSATEAAEALKYMSLAGWDVSQSTSALGGVLDLAAASGMGLGQASDMVTDYLSAFGMQAEQSSYFADMLSYAQSNSNTTAEQLGEAYRNSAANMHAAGQDVETTTSLLEAMANQGYKGSEAGTALAATMRDITQKMDNGAIKIGDTSIAVQDAQGNFRDLTDILTDVETATGGMGDAQKAAALGSTFTADSIKALNMILTEGMDKVSGYEDELRKAGGTSEKMAGIMNDNLNGDLANMSSAFEEMQLQIFENMEEPLREGVQYFTNETIPALTEWVPEAFGAAASGISKLGNALKPLFETVMKNPQAIGKAFTSIAAGFAAFKTVTAAGKVADMVSDAGGLAGALTKLAGPLLSNPWAAGAAAVTASVAAIGLAVDAYNDMRIENSLETHFGGVQLDDSQVKDFASRVINAEWLVNINAALGYFENADKLADDAEEALAANDALEWKARVGIELTPEEQDSYTSNIETFAEARIKELENRTYPAALTVRAMLKSPEGESLADSIETWAKEDMAETDVLKQQLTNLVENALTDGIIDVNEQAAIDILQTKINNILSGWKSSEAQAEMDLLTQKYGRLSGKDLESGTFTSIVEELGQQRQTAQEALEADSKEFYGVINGLMNSGRLTEGQGQDYKEQFVQAVRNSEASSLVNSLNFEGNTLSDTYGQRLQENFAEIQENTGNFLQRANQYLKDEDYTSLVNSLGMGFNDAMTARESKLNLFANEDQLALQGLYDTMKPDVAALENLIDEYRSEGQQVPKQVADAFNEAMQIGAAAGDVDAGWAMLAQQIVSDPASKAMLQAIQDGTINVPEELTAAIDRAIATAEENVTDEPVTIDGMTAELENIEVDNAKVQELLDRAMEGVEATGNVLMIDGQAMVEFEVTSGQTMSEIAAQAGIALDELIAANPQIENPNLIYVGQKINIPADLVDTDTSGVGEAVESASQEAQATADAATSTPIEATQEVNTTYAKGLEDKSALEEVNTVDNAEPVEQQVPTTVTFEVTGVNDEALTTAVNDELLAGEAVPVNAPADITVSKGNDNIAAFYTSIGTELSGVFDTNYAVDGAADITIAKASDNISSLHSEVGSLLSSTFASGYSVSTSASIWVNYSLANPTASINFGGGGTGSSTVSAWLHADGGYFDQPHLGMVAEAGGEYIIPIDGSERSREMVADAGQMLGMDMKNGAMLQPVSTTKDAGQPVSGGGSEKTISVNVNGSGTMRVSGGGASKEQIVEVMLENMREVFMQIVEQEIIEEGDGAYEF